MTVETGVALPQHYDNPGFLGLEHLKAVAHLPGSVRSVLVDVKDIYGRVFAGTSVPEYESRIERRYLSYFREIKTLATSRDLVLYLGVPALHDLAIDNSDWLMKNHRGEEIEGWICPNAPGYRELFGSFVQELARTQPVDVIFLPFCRFRRIERAGLTCCCRRCLDRFRESAGSPASLDLETIRRKPELYARWVDWRCRTLAEFLKTLRADMLPSEVRLAIEVDLDPERFFDLGVRVNDGHGLSELAEAVDELLVHLYDRTSLPDPPAVGEQPHWNSAVYRLGELGQLDTSISILFWKIRKPGDLEVRQRVAERVDPTRAFYLLFADQIRWLQA